MKHYFVKRMICCFMIMFCISILFGSNVIAQTKGKKYLVKKCNVYWMHSSGMKWFFLFRNTYKYNSKNHLISIKEKRGKTEYKKLQWKDTDSQSSTVKETFYEEVTHHTYKNGNLMKSMKYSGVGYIESKLTYKYNKRGDVIAKTYEDLGTGAKKYESKDSFKINYKYSKNGLPKQASVSNQRNTRIDKKIQKSKRVTIEKQYFDKNGLLTEIVTDHLDDGTSMNGQRTLFEYKYNKAGLVSEVTITVQSPAYGTPIFTNWVKVQYEYTDVKIDKKRYAKMINDLNCEATAPSFSHYFENWY